MASGVKVDDDCKTCFDNLKLKKDHRYIIYKLSDDLKTIMVEKQGERGETYDDFLQQLRAAEQGGQGRYAVYDCEYDKSDSKKTKLVFIMWAPDSIPVKQKMVYASSKDYLHKKMQGLNMVVQATDLCDIAQEHIESECKKLDKV